MDAETPTPQPVRKRRQNGVLLFLPAAVNRPAVVQWLKRIHAWTGFWGALAFLLIGISGFTLNHRATLKIDTGAPIEAAAVTLIVDPAAIKSPADLGKWAQSQFGVTQAPRAPRGEGGPGRQERARNDRGGRAQFMGRDVDQVAVWRQSFTGPNGQLEVEYSPGANTVKATRSAQNFLGVLKNLHKGVGMSMWWVLFIDTMAGGLVAMSLTGALLWSRLHGPRLAAIGIVLASLGLALTAAWPSVL